MRQGRTFDSDEEILIDVSRLIWRSWAGKLPTGIDRVCLAYVEHFKNRARAVVQRNGLRFVLSDPASKRLFEFSLKQQNASRAAWIKLALTLFPGSWGTRISPGTIYLNVGHTGLDNATLPDWIASNRLRAVFMVHDLIPLTHPHFCRDGEERKHARRIGAVLTSATGIIANSAATLIELERFADSQSRPVPPTLAAQIAGYRQWSAVDRIPSEKPYFVTLGTIEGRKNHQLLLRVWRRLVCSMGDFAPELLIIGQRGWKADDVLRQLDDLGPLEGHVRELNSCDDEEMAGLLASARALLMPSFAEGFGLPVIEALQMSLPVIASDLSVYREVAGEIPTYLNPNDESGWENAIRNFQTDCAERQRQLKEIKHYRAPTWGDHFHQIDAWLPTLREKEDSHSVVGNWPV